MNVDRMNGIMNAIRYYPCNIRELANLTNIPAPVVEEYINKLLDEKLAEVSHVRKLKMVTVTYYRLIDRVKRY